MTRKSCVEFVKERSGLWIGWTGNLSGSAWFGSFSGRKTSQRSSSSYGGASTLSLATGKLPRGGWLCRSRTSGGGSLGERTGHPRLGNPSSSFTAELTRLLPWKGSICSANGGLTCERKNFPTQVISLCWRIRMVSSVRCWPLRPKGRAGGTPSWEDSVRCSPRLKEKNKSLCGGLYGTPLGASRCRFRSLRLLYSRTTQFSVGKDDKVVLVRAGWFPGSPRRGLLLLRWLVSQVQGMVPLCRGGNALFEGGEEG